MSYIVRFTETNNPSKVSITVEDQTLNTDATPGVSFIGKNYAGYAQAVAENFLHLLEHFAGPTEPNPKVQGQLWFNNSAGVNQLQVWDGTKWSSTGGVKKADGSPQINDNAIKGDLYVDTSGQQLYLYNGSSWLLVGPSFSSGAKTGPQVETIVDIRDASHNVITLWVENERVAMLSTTTFAPKAAIPGFSTINAGINLNSNGSFEYYGLAEKAAALVVDNKTVPASSFLRGDVASTTDYPLNIRSASGLSLGPDLSFSLTTDSGTAVMYNKISGSSIDLKVNNSGTLTTVIRVDSSTNVGINKTNPTVALDVVGSIATDSTLKVSGTDDVVNFNSASLVVKGGTAITKKLAVGGNTTVNGQVLLNYQDTNGNIVTGAAILPAADAADGLYNIGSSTRKFNNVYANNFVGSFGGTLVGNVTGNISGSAASLTSTTNFSMTGDVLTVTPLPFNGVTSNGTATFNTVLSQDFITNKTLVSDSNDSDTFIMYRPNAGLRKIAKTTLFSNVATVPVGAIMPYAGTTPPAGWLFCDGSEVYISSYSLLFSVVNYAYKDQSLLIGYQTFALPDLRGRFPLGRDNMDNGNEVYSKETGGTTHPVPINAGGGSANRVTNTAADLIGAGTGGETTTITTANLPDHKHTLKGQVGNSVGNQYYAFRNVAGSPPDSNAVSGFGATATGQGQYLTDSGGVDVPLSTTLSTPLNVMNPYLTINYIIYTGAA